MRSQSSCTWTGQMGTAAPWKCLSWKATAVANYPRDKLENFWASDFTKPRIFSTPIMRRPVSDRKNTFAVCGTSNGRWLNDRRRF